MTMIIMGDDAILDNVIALSHGSHKNNQPQGWAVYWPSRLASFVDFIGDVVCICGLIDIFYLFFQIMDK